MKIKLAFDAGHGENTYRETGAKGVPQMAEHDFNATVVKYAKELAEYNGFEVILTQPLFGRDVPLEQRVSLANREKVDLFFSFHANAGTPSASGAYIFYWHASEEGKRMGKLWAKNMKNTPVGLNTGINRDGVIPCLPGTWTNFYVVRKTTMVALLAEFGFMTNARDIQHLLDDSYRRQCAKETVKSICEYFGKEFKEKEMSGGKQVYNPKVVKERIYVNNNKLVRCDGDYSLVSSSGKRLATDVRFIKFNKSNIRLRFVYEKNASVSQLVKKHNADFGFNFPFFWDGHILGDSKDGDKVVSSAYGKMLKWHEFIYTDGEPKIGQYSASGKYDMLVQSAPLLIENGKLVYDFYANHQEVQDDIRYSSRQRTFIGIDTKGDLLLAVADGDGGEWDKGLTLQEMALYMQSKGAVWALNGDGGGSSTMADKGGMINYQKLGERAVHHAVLVYYEGEEQEEPKQEDTSNKNWKDLGLEFLQDNYGLSDQWKAEDPIDMGTLGEIIRRVVNKND